MMLLTRRFSFSAAHRLASSALTSEESAGCYGLCENVHGHNYRLEVTVAGEPDPRTGFFCNVLDLKEVVHRLVVDPCEHRLLNDLPLFRGVPTTMENLAGRIWAALDDELARRGMRLDEVLLGETDEHWVRLRRP